MVRTWRGLLAAAAVIVATVANAQQPKSQQDKTQPPAGIQALPVDLFTTKNFYFDRQNWTDNRYVRCNTPRQLTDMWVNNRSGEWGHCNLDYDVNKIVTPYPDKTTANHYNAIHAM